MGIFGTDHIAFRTADPARLGDFYAELLDAERLDGAHEPLQVGGTTLVFFEERPRSAQTSSRSTRISRGSSARWRRGGGWARSSASRSSTRPGRAAFWYAIQTVGGSRSSTTTRASTVAGECLLLIEEQDRRLRQWDFVHCAPGTAHGFVGAGDEPCVLLLVGARAKGKSVVYGESELARRYGAGVEAETTSPAEAYAAFPHWQPGRPAGWDALPWAR